MHLFPDSTHARFAPSRQTSGVVQIKVHSGRVVSLGIWDTAGAERFESLSRMYYNGQSFTILSSRHQLFFVDFSKQRTKSQKGDSIDVLHNLHCRCKGSDSVL